MGRPLNKKYFGNRNIGSTGTGDNGIGGEGLASIAFGGTNNSVGFTNGSTTQATVPAPTLPGGVQAVLTITTFAAGALTNKTTYNTFSGTSVAAAATYTNVVQKASSASGTGATFTVAKSGSGTSYTTGTVTVTLVSAGQGYALDDTITISGADLGGVDTTNDFTFAVKTFVATTGTISSIAVTEKGSGYTSVPTVTLSTGTKGTLTVTSVLTTDSGKAGSSTNQENAILVYAKTTSGGSRKVGDIIKQVNDTTYKVKTADGTYQKCFLRTDGGNGVGTCDITAYDSDGGEYWVKKLTSRKAVLVIKGTNGGSQFATGKTAKWVFRALTSGDANNTVKIDNA